jgi:NarL family two-component system sensor histidine kinase LiaS
MLRRTTLRWQLTATHLCVTLLVIVALPVLAVVLVVLGLIATGTMPSASAAVIGEALPGLLLFSALLFLTGGSLTAVMFGQLASRPLIARIERLAAASTALAEGDLSQRVDDPSSDELGQLARAFNTMAARLATHVAMLEALGEQQAALATLQERERLSHDLHDGVTQELFSLTLLVATARAALRDQPATADVLLRDLDATLAHVLHETRSISALQPQREEHTALTDALRTLAATAPQRLGLTISLAIDEECHLPPAIAYELLLLTREALANTAHHSGVREAHVSFSTSAVEARLLIEDAGCGFAPHQPSPANGLGLRSMAERAARCGGSLTLASEPGAGTRVLVAVPLPAERPHAGGHDGG